MHPTTSAVRSALSPLLCALFATSASAKVLVPKISVCQGSICIKHGGPLVLEAAESVACTNAEIAVVPARCMSACKGKKDAKFVATFISATKKQAVLDGAYLDGDAALTAACNTIESELGVAPDALLRQAVQSKLDGDKAIESGDAKTAVESYSAAIDAVPLSFLDALVAEAAAGQEKPPPKHDVDDARIACAAATLKATAICECLAVGCGGGLDCGVAHGALPEASNLVWSAAECLARFTRKREDLEPLARFTNKYIPLLSLARGSDASKYADAVGLSSPPPSTLRAADNNAHSASRTFRWVPDPPPHFCALCGKTGSKLSVCTRCKKARYCSRHCQRAAWPSHKGPCAATKGPA